jgi:hypothetical protein
MVVYGPVRHQKNIINMLSYYSGVQHILCYITLYIFIFPIIFVSAADHYFRIWTGHYFSIWTGQVPALLF